MPYTIGGAEYEVISHKDAATGLSVIDDIQVELTREQFNRLILRLHDPHASAKNAPYLYLFQNALRQYNEYATLELPVLKAEYMAINDKNSAEAQHLLQQAYKIQQMKVLMSNLREFSQPFIILEKWMNDQGYDPHQTLDSFEGDFEAFKAAIEIQKTNLKEKYKDNAEITHLIKHRLIPRLDENIKSFSDQFKILRDKKKLLTPQHIRHLLSINRRGPNINPLGVLMGECLITTLDMGLKAAKEIQGSRLTEQFGALHGPSELTNTKLEMEIKLSTEGAGHVDTYSKTDEQLMEQYMQTPTSTPAETVTLSIGYYCPGLKSSDLIRVINVVSSVTQQNDTEVAPKEATRPLPLSIAIGTWVLVVGVVEAVFATVHLALNLVFIIPALFLPNLMETIDRMLSQWHDGFSKLVGLKNATQRWSERYLRDKKGDFKQLIQECSEPHSYFQEVFLTSLSVKSMTEIVRTSAASIASNLVVAPYRFLRYALVEATPEETFQEVNNAHDARSNYMRLLSEITPIMENKSASQVNRAKLNVINQLQIPTAFVADIIIGGSNLLVTPIFRNAPAVATTFFTISIAGFVCYLPPIAAMACLKGVASVFTAPLNVIGMQLMGSLPTTLMNQAVAGLFLWKIGVISTEVMHSIYHGHYEFLATLIENPEKLILGLVSVMALGYGLKFLPLIPTEIIVKGIKIPNLYAYIINIYIEQAREPDPSASLAPINYMLLGLQTAILLQTIADVDTPTSLMREVLKNLQEEEVLNSQYNDLEIRLERVCKSCNITVPNEVFDKIILKIQELREKPPIINTLENTRIASRAVFEIKDNSAKPQKQPQQPLSEDLEALYTQILEACDRLEHNLLFTDTPQSSARNQAMRYYDHLDALISQFNTLSQDHIGEPPIPFIDKRPILDVFYRCYCTPTRTMVGRFVSIFPLAPITYSARIISVFYGLLFGKPSWVKGAARETGDDIVMITQPIFGMVRSCWAFALYVAGVLRMPFAMLVLPVKAGEAIDHARTGGSVSIHTEAVFNDNYQLNKSAPDKAKRTLLDLLFGGANSISPHRAYDYAKRMPLIGPVVTFVGGALSSIHTNATRSVSTNDDILGAARDLKKHMESIAGKQQRPTGCSTAAIIEKKGVARSRSSTQIESTLVPDVSTLIDSSQSVESMSVEGGEDQSPTKCNPAIKR